MLAGALWLLACPSPEARGDPAEQRAALVRLLAEKGIEDRRVLEAVGRVPRHRFVDESLAARAYDDRPLPIGEEQTISQPYVVALMTEALALEPAEKVLEIGTGSGYQTAVLAEMGVEVYSIEIVEPLARRAAERLGELGYEGLHLRAGDGYRGWPEAAPFDAVIVTAAAPEIPEPLVAQLRVGGRMVLPLGRVGQELTRLTKSAEGVRLEVLVPVAFVPMTGEIEDPGAR